MHARHWVLVAACLVLGVLGPLMAWQELAHDARDRSLAALTGELPPLDTSFRAPTRTMAFVAILVIGVAGTWASVAAARAPRVRSVSGRLLFLLLLGMTLADLAFLLDARALAEAPYVTRAGLVAWIYTGAAILVAGSALRLAEVEEAFAEAPRPALAR